MVEGCVVLFSWTLLLISHTLVWEFIIYLTLDSSMRCDGKYRSVVVKIQVFYINCGKLNCALRFNFLIYSCSLCVSKLYYTILCRAGVRMWGSIYGCERDFGVSGKILGVFFWNQGRVFTFSKGLCVLRVIWIELHIVPQRCELRNFSPSLIIYLEILVSCSHMVFVDFSMKPV